MTLAVTAVCPKHLVTFKAIAGVKGSWMRYGYEQISNGARKQPQN